MLDGPMDMSGLRRCGVEQTTLEVFPSLKMPNLDHIFSNTKPYLVVKINDNQVPTTK